MYHHNQKQKQIISELGVKSVIDPEEELSISIDLLKDYLKKHKYLRTLILGISGGQDSTLTGKICQLTINELRKETGLSFYQFIAVQMPYGIQKDKFDCIDSINFINPDRILTINIKNSILASETTLRNSGIILSDFIKGNEKARERMKVQYSIAAVTSGLVVGTNHASEAVTGYFTKYGDGGTDINPIFRLNKRQGQSILKLLNCPENLYLKIPKADLEDNDSSISDESVLGVSYELIDDYLEGKNISKEATNIIEKLYDTTQHKRHLPITVFDDYWK